MANQELRLLKKFNYNTNHKKCGFTKIYQGPGNYQGKEEQIIKAILKIKFDSTYNKYYYIRTKVLSWTQNLL